MELKNFFAQDLQGNIIPSPLVYLYARGTTTPVTGLKDANGAALTNPFTATAQGQIQLQAPDGDYDLRVYSGTRDFTMAVRFIDAKTAVQTPEEQQTATAGQTVFTLATLNYIVGANNLAVYAGGARLYAGIDYTETNATTVTLTSGVPAGLKMLFKVGREVTDAYYKKPLVVLAMGQSNMRNFFAANGGDETIEPDVFMWDTNAITAPVVAGTRFNKATWGVAPLNITNGALRAQSLALHTANNLKLMTGRPVYVIQIAAGGHAIESFIPAAGLTANGWALHGTNQDMSLLMYPGIAQALALVPGAPTTVDALIWHQGEANSDDGPYTYARKFQVMWNYLVSAGVVDAAKTRIAAGQIGQTSSNVHLDQHTSALERLEIEYANFRVVSSQNIEMLTGGNLHFSGAGIVNFGQRYADALYSNAKVDVPTLTLDSISPRSGLGAFTFFVSNVHIADRLPIPLTNATMQFANGGPLGESYYSPANTGNLFSTRKIFRIADNRSIRISYEMQVDAVAGSVDHRAIVYQFDKNMVPIASLVSTPPSSPASGADGRVFVSRTYKRAGSAVVADTTLAAGCEFIALGVNFGVGADDEAYWFNILELSA